MSARLFEGQDHSEAYSRFRPTYPKEVFDKIVQFYRKSVSQPGSKCDFTLAVDLGCGNGQSTRPLKEYFQNVIGTDISGAQINKAKRDHGDSGISFNVGSGEDPSFLSDTSIDLVTVAQAVHWMDLKTLYAEIDRVLKPGGVFSPYGYGIPQLKNPGANTVVTKLYEETLGEYWNKKIQLLDDGYKDLELCYPDVKRIDEIQIERVMPLSALMGYLSSWSAWREYIARNPGTNIDDVTRQKLHDILYEDKGDEDPTVEMSYPVFLLLVRKPF